MLIKITSPVVTTYVAMSFCNITLPEGQTAIQYNTLEGVSSRATTLDIQWAAFHLMVRQHFVPITSTRASTTTISERIYHFQEWGNDHEGHASALEGEGSSVLVHLPLVIQSAELPYSGQWRHIRSDIEELEYIMRSKLTQVLSFKWQINEWLATSKVTFACILHSLYKLIIVL